MTVINLENTPARKFQVLADELNKQGASIAALEQNMGVLAMISKLEDLFQSLLKSKLGLSSRFISDKSSGYIENLLTSSHVPSIILKRRLSLDIANAVKKGDVSPVIGRFKNELVGIVKSVHRGEEPFDENYLVFEVEGCLPTDSQGTLASFKGALPVNKLSLVDREEADRDFVAKEIKKNHFILKPTSEYLRQACLKALYSKALSEEELRNYLHIARTGIYKIVKEHISESANYTYKTLGDKITLSPIRHKGAK